MASRKEFAEFQIASLLSKASWDIYIPYRDKGWDFIASKRIKTINGVLEIFRPIQIKGKYSTTKLKNYKQYGYRGKLSKVHDDMVIAIPFYPLGTANSPVTIAFLPKSRLQCSKTGIYQAAPCSYQNHNIIKLNDYIQFFDSAGISLMEDINWKNK